MIPNTWRLSTIEEISTISSGGTPSRKIPEYWEGDIPWVTTAEVKFGTIMDAEEKITIDGLNNSSAKLFPRNAILMAMYGQGKTRGQVAKLGIEAATNQACAAIILKEGFDVDYYFQFLQSRYEHIRSMSNSGGQENLSAGIVKSIQVPIPPMSEQIKIAKILFIWDQAISTTEKLLVNNQKTKRSLVQQLLTGRKRFSEFKENWETTKFEDIFEERVEMGREDLPLLSITADDGVVYQDETGRKDTSNEDKSKYRRICVGDIGYNTMRMWQGRSSLSDKDGIVSPAYTIIRSMEGAVLPQYAAYLFKLPNLIHVFYRHSQGLVSDTWNLKYKHFSQISWPIPKLLEQEKIAKTLSLVDAETDALLHQVEYLKKEKKALMQALLTGKRRVKI